MLKLTKIMSVTAMVALAAEVTAATDWNVSLWGKRRAFTEHVEKISELVAEKTKGEFNLRISYGGLSQPNENLNGLSIGAFQMAQFCSFYHPGKNPTITVTELPFTKNLNLAQMSELSKKVYEHPLVKEDMARWNAMLLMPSPMPQYNLIGTSKTPKELSDFKGSRLRAPGGIAGVMTQLGAVNTGVPANEVRQSLDAGLIDTVAFAEHAHLAFSSIQAGKWATTNLNLGSADCPVIVNVDAFNKLSDEHKQALLGSVDEALDFYIKNYEENVITRYNKGIEKLNIEKVTFTPEQVDELEKLSKTVREQWVAEYKDKFNSQELFDFTQALVRELAK